MLRVNRKIIDLQWIIGTLPFFFKHYVLVTWMLNLIQDINFVLFKQIYFIRGYYIFRFIYSVRFFFFFFT